MSETPEALFCTPRGAVDDDDLLVDATTDDNGGALRRLDLSPGADEPSASAAAAAADASAAAADAGGVAGGEAPCLRLLGVTASSGPPKKSSPGGSRSDASTAPMPDSSARLRLRSLCRSAISLAVLRAPRGA